MRKIIQKSINRFGYRIVSIFNENDVLMNNEIEELFQKVKKKIGSSTERIYALHKALEYLDKARIEGDLVETGVWKGGTCMAMAYSIKQLNLKKRKIWLYDTYTGMEEPTKEDISFLDNVCAKDTKRWQGLYTVSLKEVKRNMLSTGYPEKELIFVKGKVEDTIPQYTPNKIALLRLDTDWYESTKHSIEQLFPLLQEGGVLLLDDYGNWKGAKKAIDNYFDKNKINILLNRIDHTGRIGIK